MSQCPQCSAEIDADFGMMSCPSCGAMLFIDMEGRVQLGQDSEAESPPVVAQSSESFVSIGETASAADPRELEHLVTEELLGQSEGEHGLVSAEPTGASFLDDFSSSELDGAEPESFHGEDSSESAIEPPLFVDLNEDSPEEGVAADGASEDSGFATEMEGSGEAFAHPQEEDKAWSEQGADSSPDLGGEASEPEIPEGSVEVDSEEGSHTVMDDAAFMETPEQELSPVDSLDQIAEFGNQNEDISGGDLVYTVQIHGIDSSDLRRDLKEALTDSRFAWDVEALMNRAAKGMLSIENMNPVKTAVLVGRLRHLPLKILWRQHAISSQ